MKPAVIIFSIIVALVFGVSYLLFGNKVTATSIMLSKQLEKEQEKLQQEHSSYVGSLTESSPQLLNYLPKLYDGNQAIVYRDTLVSFFVYRKLLQVPDFEPQYFQCLDEGLLLEQQNDSTRTFGQGALSKLLTQTDSYSNSWITNIDEKVFYKIKPSNSCSGFFKFNVWAWSQETFEVFKFGLDSLDRTSVKYSKITQKAEQQLQSNLNSVYYTLTQVGKEMLASSDKDSAFFDNYIFKFNYSTTELGDYKVSIPYKEFNSTRFDQQLESIYEEQYKNNSLATGTKPYSYCYGVYNSCPGYGCSEIKVITPSSSDVLVTIKKNGEVYRHAYIKAGSVYTFNVPNGAYQPFFYYGKGWNPNKYMKETSCGKLKGGFVSAEDFAKDESQSLYNQILTYELIQQFNGNFSTRPSNLAEAL